MFVLPISISGLTSFPGVSESIEQRSVVLLRVSASPVVRGFEFAFVFADEMHKVRIEACRGH